MGDYDTIISALNRQGWSVSDANVAPAWCAELRRYAQELWAANCFEPGEFGLDPAGGKEPEVRGDAICWVPPGSRL